MDDSSGSARLSELFAAACASRPDLNIDEASFKEFLRARPARLEPAALSHAGDLALVFACERGDASAMRVLENEHLARLGDLLPVRYRGEASEVAQILRDRLLVPDATGKMKIGEFSGRGDLRSWLRVAAVRIAINLERRHKREVTLREEDHALGDRAMFDLELDHLKRRYSREFKEAFTAALGGGVCSAKLETSRRQGVHASICPSTSWRPGPSSSPSRSRMTVSSSRHCIPRDRTLAC